MRRRIDIAIATAALVLGAAVPYGAARHAKTRLQHGFVDRLASALGEPVHVDGVQAGLTGEFVIRGLRIGDLVALDTLDIRLDVPAALSGRTEVREIRAAGAHVNARIDADGSSDLARLASRVRELARDLRTRGHAGMGAGARARAPIALSLTDGSLAAELERYGRVQISGIAVRARLGQPSVRVSAGRVHVDGARGALAVRGELGRMAADIDTRERRLLRLVSVDGNLSLISPTGETTQLSRVSITRGLGAADGEPDDEPDNEIVRLDAQVLGPAAGEPAPMTLALLGGSGRVERLELRGQALPLAVLEPWSPRSLDFTNTRFSGRALVELAPATARLEADGAVHELTIDDARVAREPVTLTGDMHARVSASFAGQDTGAEAGHRIALEQLVWDTPGLRVQLSGEVGYQRRARSDTGRAVARDTWLPDTASLSLVIPTTRCASALGAMPEVFRRRLVGLDLSGSMSARVAIEFRRATVKDTRLDVDVDAGGCRVLRDALAADPRGIAQRPAAADARSTERSAPPERAYATLDQLPEYTQRAFVTMEDARFFRHHGFDSAQIERSLAVDLNAAAFVRGGSTITQQLVKNAFLSHERTLARKFQEAVLTWRVEAVAKKSQILERYLNIIELGPDTHGIEAAARYWFGKSADRLGVRESAFLAALTPAPRTISRRILEHGGIDPATNERIDQVLAVMRRHDVISERIYQKALRFPLELMAAGSTATSLKSASARSSSDAQEQAVAEVALQL